MQVRCLVLGLDSAILSKEWKEAVWDKFVPGAPATNEGVFESLAEVRRTLAVWRYDYNNARPHPLVGNKPTAETRPTLEPFDDNVLDALAQPRKDHYQPNGLSHD